MSASSLAEPVPAAAPAAAVAVDVPRWSLATRVAFRFFFCFFLLCYLPFPVDAVPGVEEAWTKLWVAIVMPVGKVLFGITADATFNGSGDKSFNWIQYFVIVVVSAAVTLIWSITRRKTASYPRLHAWFHLYIRFALAAVMISYGSFKVIPSQFIPAPLDRLMQPFGNASPMGLLWTFMGASVAYTIFTGIGEFIGGLLLTIRRTSLLGALISAGVMTHVVVLNFCYDVPVKLFSSQLLLTALVIAAPDARRLAGFFARSEPATRPVVRSRILRIAGTVLAVVAVLLYSGMLLRTSWKQRTMLQDRLAPSSLSGIWNIDELTIDGVNHPPLTTDATRWRRLIVSGKAMGVIQSMDDAGTRYQLVINERQQTLTLRKRLEPAFEAKFIYKQIDPNTLTLDGVFERKRMVATLHKAADRTFLLNTRGFHWVNESPFNR